METANEKDRFPDDADDRWFFTTFGCGSHLGEISSIPDRNLMRVVM